MGKGHEHARFPKPFPRLSLVTRHFLEDPAAAASSSPPPADVSIHQFSAGDPTEGFPALSILCNLAGLVYTGGARRLSWKESVSAEVSSEIPPGKSLYDAVGYYCRCQFTARKHIITHRYLPGDQMITYPLIHPFIMTAKQNDVVLGSQIIGRFLCKPSPSGVRYMISS